MMINQNFSEKIEVKYHKFSLVHTMAKFVYFIQIYHCTSDNSCYFCYIE